MSFNFKPLIDAIPRINSVYSLITFSLLLLAIFISIIIKNKQFLRIIEKKFTKAQAYKFLRLFSILCFAFACFVFLLGYVFELAKIFQQKSGQTSVIVYDKIYDVSGDNLSKKSPIKGYFIGTNPNFSFPAPDLNLWEKPLWANNKEDLLKYFSISLPKGLDLKNPFFDFIAKGNSLFIFSKQQVSLQIDKLTTILNQSPLADEKSLDFPFDEPFSIKGRHYLAIVAIPKTNLESKFKIVTIPDLISFYLSTLFPHVNQLISTKNSAVLIHEFDLNNAIFQSKRQNIKISKYIRFLESPTHFFIIEGSFFGSDQNTEIQDYIAFAVFHFILPKE